MNSLRLGHPTFSLVLRHRPQTVSRETPPTKSSMMDRTQKKEPSSFPQGSLTLEIRPVRRDRQVPASQSRWPERPNNLGEVVFWCWDPAEAIRIRSRHLEGFQAHCLCDLLVLGLLYCATWRRHFLACMAYCPRQQATIRCLRPHPLRTLP